MPAKINSETEAAILALHQNGVSRRKISSTLSSTNTPACTSVVSRVIKEFQLERSGHIKPEKKLPAQNMRTVRTPAMIQKVKNLVHRPDPYSQRQISQQLGISARTVRRIIRQDLAGVLRHKRKTHMLSDKQVSQRLLKIPRLLKHLEGEKWRYIVSIDEAWVYLTHVNGRRKVYYQFRGKRSPQSWMKYCQQKHPRGVMFVAGISARGPTAIRFVPPSTKVNSDFYVHRVLQPLFQKDIKRLYGKSAKRVKLHHDSAPAHRALATVRFMQENKYKFIPASDWPANSPDLSPMDYSINGIFKQRLWKRKAKDLQGLVRAMKQEWSLISKKLCVETLESWSTRAQRVLDNSGYQIEHLV